jgi:hypothetical protein
VGTESGKTPKYKQVGESPTNRIKRGEEGLMMGELRGKHSGAHGG